MMVVNSSTLTDPKDIELYKAAQAVNLYLPPVIIILGCVVNVLSILVMRSHYFRNVSTSIYMTAGAINDSTSLLVALLPHWLFVNYPYVFKRTDASDGMCKFFNFYGYSNTDFTMILTACMTADRAYAVKFPLRVATADMVKRAKIMIVVGAVIVSIKNFHFWFCSVMSPPESKERLCTIKATGEKFEFFVLEVWPWIHNVFLGVSLIVVLVSNSVIIYNVMRSSAMGDYSGQGHRTGPPRDACMRRESVGSIGSSGRRRQITVMMLAESFTTLILSYPFAWYTLFSAKDPEIYTVSEKWAMNQLLFAVFFYMLYSNKCVNFFLYVVSGHKFRLALKQVFTWHRGSSETAHGQHDGHIHFEMHAYRGHAHLHDASNLRGSLSTITTSTFSNDARMSSIKKSHADGDAAQFAAHAHRRHSVTFCLQSQVCDGQRSAESDVKGVDVRLTTLERITSQRRLSATSLTIERQFTERDGKLVAQDCETQTDNTESSSKVPATTAEGDTTERESSAPNDHAESAKPPRNADARSRPDHTPDSGTITEKFSKKPEPLRSVEILIARAAKPRKVVSIGVRCMMRPRRGEKRIARLIEFIPLFLPVNAVPETEVG